MTRHVHVDRTLHDMTPEQAHAWKTWLHRHGIHAEDVLLGFDIECDDQACTITFTTPAANAAGRRYIDPETGEPAVTRAVCQLEAPALPMPSGVEP